MTEEHGEQEGASQSERYGEDYAQRQDVRLVLCRQDEVDEHDTQQEDDTRSVRSLGLLTRQTGVVVGIASSPISSTALMASPVE